MSFTIPNEADAAYEDQAEPDKVDFDILIAGTKGDGVVDGCLVSPQGTPDMTVAVASGNVSVAGVKVAVSADNVTITAADGSNPRFDLIVSDNTGTLSASAGTPAANPVFPAIPANSVVLAAVYVPASDTTIEGDQIVDKRVILLQYGALAQAETWAALQTFSAGIQLAAGQTIKDSGGTARIKVSTSSPEVEIDDDLRVERIGLASAPDAANVIRIRPISSISVTQIVIDCTPTYTALGNQSVSAIQGVAALYGSSGGVSNLSGLDFTVNPICQGVTATFQNVNALQVTAQPIAILATGIITVNNMYGVKIQLNATKIAGAGAPQIDDLYAIEVNQNWVAANATITNYHGIEQADVPMTPSGFNRLIEMGGVIGTTPNLRLEGFAPSDPGASKGRSQLLLTFNENGSVAIRRVEWIDSGAAGGAGIPANTKVLVAV